MNKVYDHQTLGSYEGGLQNQWQSQFICWSLVSGLDWFDVHSHACVAPNSFPGMAATSWTTGTVAFAKSTLHIFCRMEFKGKGKGDEEFKSRIGWRVNTWCCGFCLFHCGVSQTKILTCGISFVWCLRLERKCRPEQSKPETWIVCVHVRLFMFRVKSRSRVQVSSSAQHSSVLMVSGFQLIDKRELARTNRIFIIDYSWKDDMLDEVELIPYADQHLICCFCRGRVEQWWMEEHFDVS